jgi:hypothetical protein
MSCCTTIDELFDTVVVVLANTLRIAHVPASAPKPRLSDTRLAAVVLAAYLLEARTR